MMRVMHQELHLMVHQEVKKLTWKMKDMELLKEVAEGDEDDIEVDVVEGESRVAKRGTLKREANSLNHKLTHRYKNPYCDSCIRAKMKHFKTRRGSYKRELKKFGDLITFDAVDTSKVHDDVLILEKEVLVVRDCFTGIIGAYPSDRMTKGDGGQSGETVHRRQEGQTGIFRSRSTIH